MKKVLDREKQALAVIDLLEKRYPQAKIALIFKNPLELLVATILSAQCTDKRVNIVTKDLFKKYKTAKDYAEADLKQLEEDIKPTGFYHNKANNIKNCCTLLVEKYRGQVPKTMEEMLELPGVARKTANIVLSNAYGVVEGVAVDTHVRRTSKRLGLTDSGDPKQIEQDLMDEIPRNKWMRITDLMIFLGRDVCTAGIPRCEDCILNQICPSAFTFGAKKSRVYKSEKASA